MEAEELGRWRWRIRFHFSWIQELSLQKPAYAFSGSSIHDNTAAICCFNGQYMLNLPTFSRTSSLPRDPNFPFQGIPVALRFEVSSLRPRIHSNTLNFNVKYPNRPSM